MCEWIRSQLAVGNRGVQSQLKSFRICRSDTLKELQYSTREKPTYLWGRIGLAHRSPHLLQHEVYVSLNWDYWKIYLSQLQYVVLAKVQLPCPCSIAKIALSSLRLVSRTLYYLPIDTTQGIGCGRTDLWIATRYPAVPRFPRVPHEGGRFAALRLPRANAPML